MIDSTNIYAVPFDLCENRCNLWFKSYLGEQNVNGLFEIKIKELINERRAILTSKSSLLESKVAKSKLMEVFLESCPQFILQTSIILRTSEDLNSYIKTTSGIIKILSVTTSFTSLMLGASSVYKQIPQLTAEWVINVDQSVQLRFWN